MDQNDVGVIICCAGQDAVPVRYGERSAGCQPEIICFPIYCKGKRRQDALDQASRAVCACAARGQKAAVHCNEGYHRAPMGAAAIVTRVEGSDPEKFLAELAPRRKIWPGFRDASFWEHWRDDITREAWDCLLYTSPSPRDRG